MVELCMGTQGPRTARKYQGSLPNVSSCQGIAVQHRNFSFLTMSWHVRLCTRLILCCDRELGRGMRTRLPLLQQTNKETKKTELWCVYMAEQGCHQKWFYSSLLFFSTRRGTYASSGSGLRSGGRRGSSRLPGGTGTGGGHSGHSADSGDSLADDDDDI